MPRLRVYHAARSCDLHLPESFAASGYYAAETPTSFNGGRVETMSPPGLPGTLNAFRCEWTGTESPVVLAPAIGERAIDTGAASAVFGTTGRVSMGFIQSFWHCCLQRC